MTVSADVLLDEIAPDLVAFLKEGSVLNLTSFAAKALPELSKPDLDRLLRLHFVLTRTRDGEVGVIDFVRDLPDRLQRIRTTVEPRTRRYEGEVHGRVQWNRTLPERWSRIGSASLLFVCDEIERNYETAENQVLKAVIEIIAGIVQVDMASAFQTRAPTWLGEWAPVSHLRDTFLAASNRNVYLRRIKGDADRITDATIARALRSRLPLYREAAALLARYRRLMRHDLDTAEARELLAFTFIQPGRVEVLFELYWVLRIIRAFREYRPRLIRFLPIEYGSSCVARWTLGSDTYEIHHDSVAGFTFSETAKAAGETLRSPDSYFGRMLRAREELNTLMASTSDHLWGGRPDLVLEVTRSDGQCRVLLGEVKYTCYPDYAAQGLRELLEYMALAKGDERYVVSYNDLFGLESPIRGCLFTDGLEQALLEEAGTVRHLMHGQAPAQLDELVSWLVESPTPAGSDQS